MPPADRKAWPRFSIVTPSFNQGRFLEHTIRSVLLQNYPNLEYIVMDGGSTDGSRDIIEKYRRWLAVAASERDAGQADALNKGFSKATGHVHAYLNSDDYYLPGAFHTVAQSLPEPLMPCLITGACEIVDENGGRLRTQRGAIRTFGELVDLWGIWYRGGYLPQPAVFWANPAGPGTRFRADLHYVMDYELWGRLLQERPRVIEIAAALAAFRTYAAQKSTSTDGINREVQPILDEWLRRPGLRVGQRLLIGADLAYAMLRQSLSTVSGVARRRAALAASLLTRPRIWISRQLYRDIGHAISRATRLGALDAVFRRIAAGNAWGGSESISGPGSGLAQTEVIRAAIPQLLDELGCRAILDAPCGDFRWLSQVRLPAEYWGCDIVEGLVASNTAKFGSERIRFFRADVSRDTLPHVDLILCRDCLVHLPDDVVRRVLGNFVRSGSRYLLTTTFPDRDRNDPIAAGEWRPLNLQRPPFNLPPPLRLINENCTEGGGAYRDKSLGLWDLQTLREDVAVRAGS
jgi:glycosyltransferase involved in cell wall biosynthesis